MKCNNCGNELRKGAKFCRICGSPVEEHPYVYQNRSVAHASESLNRNPNNDSVNRTDRKRGKKVAVILTSIVSLVVVAAIILTVVMVNHSQTAGDYRKVFRVYKNELEQAKADIENYADHHELDDSERKLVAVSSVLGNQKPSLFYVVEGQDREENKVPIIRMCEMQGNTAQNIFESMVDYSPIDLISILKNSQTGETYLFADSELSDGGNVVIYSLTKDKDIIRQKEKYRLTYVLHSDDENGTYDYQYFIDQSSVIEEDYNNAVKDFVSTIDTVIVSSNNRTKALKYNYFKDIVSVAMSYDEAMDYLDNGINGATIDEVKPQKNQAIETEESVKETEAPKVYDVNPEDLPESLTRFLQQFDFAYSTSSYEAKEFDCENTKVCYDYLVNHIVGNPCCVDGTLYPGGDEKKIWEANADPLGKFGNMATLEYPKEKLMWVLENIFHISEDDRQGMLQAAMDADPDLYEYDKDGKTYLYRKTGGVGGPGFNVAYETVRYDGERYYFIYDCVDAFSSKNTRTFVYYAEMAQEEIDGETYWTMYKHTSDIPELPEPNTGSISDEDIFSMFAGEYSFTSGAGAWSTQLKLNPDGTFTGEYHDTDAGVRGDGYDATLYLSKFSGKFKNPKKINSYTYSFKLDEINYENEPDTEEIGDPYGSGGKVKVLIKYSTAYGLSGAETVYAYTPSAPTAQLPEKLMSWVGFLRDKSTRNNSNLSYYCLYAVEPECGWIGEKE